MTLGLILTFVITTLFCVYWRFKNSEKYKYAEEIGGPPTYPIIGNAYTFIKQPTIEAIMEINQSIKKIGRLWMGNLLVIIIKDPELYEAVLNSKTSKDKGDFYRLLIPIMGYSLVTSDWPYWHKMRKIISPMLNALKVRSYTYCFTGEYDRLANEWKDKVDMKFKPFKDISRTTFCCTIRTAIGDDDFELWSREEISNLADIVKRAMDSVGYRFMRPWLHNDIIWSLVGHGRRLNRDKKIFWKAMDQMIEHKFENPREGDSSFVRYMIDSSKNETLYTRADIRSELSTYLLAGFETTSAAMTLSLVMLGCYPDLQEKVVEEQRAIFDTSLRHAENDDILQMTYLEQFIKETLRLYPSIPFFGQQMREDFKLGQYTIPKGTLALIAPYITHREPSLFKDPETFDPENFSAEQEKTRHPWSFIGFGGGPRSCIGQKYAMQTIKVCLSTIVRRYIVETDYKEKDIKPEMDVAIKADDFMITLRQRPVINT